VQVITHFAVVVADYLLFGDADGGCASQ